MKKMIFLMLAMLAFVLESCTNEPKTAPLEGNPDFVTFTQNNGDGVDSLWVTNKQTGQVVVPPDTYSKIVGDEYAIYGQKKDGKWELFNINGEHIGSFEMVTPWKNGGTYYLGVNYTFKTYYFPKEDFIITSQKVHSEHEVLFVETQGYWLVLNYDGKMLRPLPKDFTIIKDAKIPTNIKIAVFNKSKFPSCTLYNPSGDKYKKLTPAEWRKLKRELTLQKEIDDSATVVTIENFNHL